MTVQHILVVDDEPDIRDLVQEILVDEGYEVSVADNAATARERRRQRRPDLILLDIWMPGEDGVSLLKEWRDAGGTPCPVIMMSGHGTVETAVEATRLGAYDFIEKPLTLAKLLVSVRRALQVDQLERENAGLRQYGPQVGEPVGSSIIMQALRGQARKVAQHDTWLLIAGEPGAGKETIARYIHSVSSRSNAAFIKIDVAPLAHIDATPELFGSEFGDSVRYGLLEQANGGILFIDEVGGMELQAQGRLVNALEEGRFVRVGGNETVDVDVRVIAATSRDLQRDVEAGKFREDLYYRLNIVPVQVPPLREHVEDTPELLNYYVDYYSTREGLPYRRFSIAAQNRLLHHGWPGNVLELRNLVQRLLILGASDEISVEEIESALSEWSSSATQGYGLQLDVFELPLRQAREAFERTYLLHQLKGANGSVSKLSERVGMERTHLYRKLRSLGINPKEVD